MLDPPDTADAPPLTNLIALVAGMGHRRSATTSSSTRAASASCVGRGPGMPVVADYPAPPDHRALQQRA